MFDMFTTAYDFVQDRNDVVDGECIQFNMSLDGDHGITFQRDRMTDTQWMILMNRAQKYPTIFGVAENV